MTLDELFASMNRERLDAERRRREWRDVNYRERWWQERVRELNRVAAWWEIRPEDRPDGY